MKHGFTLLELSIVLVVIGLIVGGVTAGQDLIRSAELKSVISDFNKYKVAVNTFKLQYNAIPGDMDNAEDYWGTADIANATCKITTVVGTETCNGDGDGIVNATPRSSEEFRFWQHLANSEIIAGRFTGTAGSGGASHAVIAENTPGRNNIGWTSQDLFVSPGFFAGNGAWFAGTYGNIFRVGGQTSSVSTVEKVFSPLEVHMIDQKLDNGKPGKGSVIAYHWNDCTDAADQNDTNSDYLLSDDALNCAIIFIYEKS